MAAPHLLCGRGPSGARAVGRKGPMTATAPQYQRQANDTGQWRGRPIAQARRSNHTATAIASDLDRLPRAKELADAEFWTAAGLETVSVLRDV